MIRVVEPSLSYCARDVILDVSTGPALEHQRTQAFFSQLLGGPATADPGADYDRVVFFFLLNKHGTAREAR